MGATGTFGPRLKELRIREGLTLREFCKRGQFDPGNFSRLERGLFTPPSAQKVAEYLAVLGIGPGNEEYTDLLDRAAADRGQLPADVLEDEELVRELPALFRTLRGDAIDGRQRDSLIDLIRKR